MGDFNPGSRANHWIWSGVSMLFTKDVFTWSVDMHCKIDSQTSIFMLNAILDQSRLRWAEQVIWMRDDRIPMIIVLENFMTEIEMLLDLTSNAGTSLKTILQLSVYLLIHLIKLLHFTKIGEQNASKPSRNLAKPISNNSEYWGRKQKLN